MNLVFIFSLPRSGSTLLQNLLIQDPELQSISEPWVLLPPLYALKRDGMLAEYSHLSAQSAITEAIQSLPEQEKTYKRLLGEFFSGFYESLVDENAKYFVEKTPRYHLIIDDIAEMFPNAKFIFLHRNPLDVLSSIFTTWLNNSFIKLPKHFIDIYEGPENLSSAYTKYADRSIAVAYQELVSDPQTVLKRINQHLGSNIPFDSEFQFTEQNGLNGSKGDPNWAKKYNSISSLSINAWTETFNNVYRKAFLKKFLAGVNEAYLGQQGLSRSDLLREVSKVRSRGLGLLDWIQFSIGRIYFKSLIYLAFNRRIRIWIKKYIPF